MVKKVLVVAGGVALLLGLLFGRNVCSYVSTAADRMHQTVRDNVPIDFEIDRAKKMIQSLDKDIMQNRIVIAREEVKVAKLEKQITGAKDQLAKRRTDILRLTDDLESGTESFVYSGEVFTAKQVKSDLANRFEQFQVQEKTLTDLNRILSARKSGLQAAQDKFAKMKATKAQLKVEVEHLEARLKILALTQAESDVSLDDGRLSQTKELVSDIKTRLEVAESLVGTEGSYVGEIKLDDQTDENQDIVEQVTDYFGEGRAKVQALVTE
ncbi:MAG: hypothetical protein QF805_26905 [Pirellulaceae bacterium]|jgi:chromosome segregation ATPase|nr:hypothetical protein [Pirellulaceae bacterium]